MVDIHCHILPGIDDGAPDLATSAAMCRAAKAQGVTHIVATPHLSDQFEFDPALNALKREEVEEACGGAPALLAGCDFHLNEINLALLEVNPNAYTIAGRNHLLVENSNFSLPPNIERMFHALQQRGIIPVLTHPERNPLWQRKPDLLKRLAGQDCVIQVTAGAFLGKFGRMAEKCAFQWLKDGLIHVVASDAHNMTGRPYNLRPAFDAVARKAGAEVAELLFVDNPLAIIQGYSVRTILRRPRRRWFFGL